MKDRVLAVMGLSFLAGAVIGAGLSWTGTLIVGFGTAIACGIVEIIRIGLDERRKEAEWVTRVHHPSHVFVIKDNEFDL